MKSRLPRRPNPRGSGGAARRWPARRAAILAVLVVAASCDRSAATTARVERIDSAGIEIVRNLGGDRPLDWTFQVIRRLGGAESGPEAFYVLGEWLVDTDRRGQIHVLDPSNFRVVTFDSTGRHVRTAGREGRGPGEMAEPMALWVATDGSIAVADYARPHLLRWDASGSVLATGDSLLPLPMTHKPFGVVEDELLAMAEAPATSEDSVDWRLMRIQGATPVTLATARRAKAAPRSIGCAFGLISPLFSPDIVWDAMGGRLAIATGADYEVQLLDGEQETWIRRDLPVREVSREMALQQLRDGFFSVGFQRMECPTPAEERLEAQGYHSVLPAVADIEVGYNGSFWVRRGSVRGEPSLIDFFSNDGAYEGTLPPDSPFPVAFLPNGDIVAIERDEMDIDRVVVYRITRSRSGIAEPATP